MTSLGIMTNLLTTDLLNQKFLIVNNTVVEVLSGDLDPDFVLNRRFTKGGTSVSINPRDVFITEVALEQCSI